jgi:ribonuclease BN (tRNA processing enzyme)
VVGCSGSYPGPDSPASCYLLQAGHEGRTYSLVVDLGNGALGALQRHVDLADVDAVVLSHLHVDHCIDLASYYVVRTYQPGGMLPPLPVHGPAGGSARVAAASGFPDRTGVDKVFDFFDWKSGRAVQLGPFTVTPAQVAHPVETYALRIEEQGRVLVYSGDSGPSTALVDLASGADLFLCEASFLVGGDNPPDLHLTGREAGLHASRAGVGRLLLTHIPAWVDEIGQLFAASAVFSETELVHTGATYEI